MTSMAPRPLFARSLAAELDARGMTQRDLADLVGVRQNTVSRWVAADGFAPDPDRVFAIEAALDLPPGALSQHLGYAPVEARPTPSVLEAIEAAPNLEPWQRDALVAVYSIFVRAPREEGGRRSDRPPRLPKR